MEFLDDFLLYFLYTSMLFEVFIIRYIPYQKKQDNTGLLEEVQMT